MLMYVNFMLRSVRTGFVIDAYCILCDVLFSFCVSIPRFGWLAVLYQRNYIARINFYLFDWFARGKFVFFLLPMTAFIV